MQDAIFRLKALLVLLLFPVLWPVTVFLETLPDCAREIQGLAARVLYGRKWRA